MCFVSQFIKKQLVMVNLKQMANINRDELVRKRSLEEVSHFSESQDSNDSQQNSCDSFSSQIGSQEINKRELEVEMILDRKETERGLMYLVKWKGYSRKYSSWIRRLRLDGCEKQLYYFDLLIDPPLEKLPEKMIRYFIQDITTRKDLLTLRKLCSVIFGNSEEAFIMCHKLKLSDLVKITSKFLQLPTKKMELSLSKFKSNFLNLMRDAEARKHVLLALCEWQDEINKVANPPVVIENDVDDEEAPEMFQYITDYINPFSEITQPSVSCKCEDCYKNQISCCASNFPDAAFAYTKNKHLRLLPGYPIFECNDLCKCSTNCPNRVVQQGSKIHVSIFRTSDGRGWGLKTLQSIRKDKFVIEYLGEVITSEEAERRGNLYDCIGLSYLFDLDYEDHTKYTVDGGVYGNAAHFINHSCAPNMQVFTVWINNHDLDLPRIAFFTKRRIEAGEELTFDYKMVDSRTKKGIVIPENDRMLCRCKAENCRKYLF